MMSFCSSVFTMVVGALVLALSAHNAHSAALGPPDEDLNQVIDFGGKCLHQMAQCDPYRNGCCPGMKCANFIGAYCLRGLEKCICVPEAYGN